MPFATRADLLARSNARTLAQLAVPTDVGMVPVDALRTAIGGGDLTGFTEGDQAAIGLALNVIDAALADADALLVSYGVPGTVQNTLLARLASTVALYYLYGAEMTDDVLKAYQGVIDVLKAYARGDVDLVQGEEEGATPTDSATITSGVSRYGRRPTDEDDEA